MNNFKKLHRVHQAAWLGIGIVAIMIILAIILSVVVHSGWWLSWLIGAICYLIVAIWQIIIGVQEKHTLSLVAGIFGIFFWPVALILDIVIVASKK